MQYTNLILSMLAASGAIAAPQGFRSNSAIDISLDDQAILNIPLGQFYSIPSHKRFSTVTLHLGAEVKNQNLRCQLLRAGEGNFAKILERNGNVDITFAEGTPWTFRFPGAVRGVICKNDFVKADKSRLEMRVVLTKNGQEPSVTVFDADDKKKDQDRPEGSYGPYNEVELDVGDLVEKQDYRCRIFDEKHRPITVTRGDNKGNTFADGNKGKWKFEKTLVSQIVCDPSFEVPA